MLQQDASLDHVAEAHGGVVERRAVRADRRRSLGSSSRSPVVSASSTHLERLHEEARAGARRLVFITGEAGIGKTTIVESLVARAGAAAQTLVAHGQCVEHRGAGEPYLPVLEALGRLARQPSGRQLVPLLARQAPTWLAQMPWLLADDELEAVQRRLIGATPLRMLREMLETLEVISQEIDARPRPRRPALERPLDRRPPRRARQATGSRRACSSSARTGAATPSRRSIPSTVSRGICAHAACAPRSRSGRSAGTPSRTT